MAPPPAEDPRPEDAAPDAAATADADAPAADAPLAAASQAASRTASSEALDANADAAQSLQDSSAASAANAASGSDRAKRDRDATAGSLARTGSRFGSLRNLLGAGKEPAPAGAAAPAADDAAAAKYEHTYRLKPEKKFQSEPVQRLIEATLSKHLEKVKYDTSTVIELTKTISNELLSSVKGMGYDRYKFVVDVTIGEFKGQGIRVASRCLWDTTVDSYASASFKNNSTFAVAMVFGIYFE